MTTRILLGLLAVVLLTGAVRFHEDGTAYLFAGDVKETLSPYIESPTAETFSGIWTSPTATTVERIWCQTDQGTIDLVVQNAGVAVNTVVTCNATGATATLSGDTTFDVDALMNLVFTADTGTPGRVSTAIRVAQ